MHRYLRVVVQIVIAIDQLLNTLLGGWADETVSARAWRQQRKLRWWVAKEVIDSIFFIEDHHCYRAYLAEQERRHLPPQLRLPPIDTLPQ